MRWEWSERNRTVGFTDILGLLGVVGLAVARFVPVAQLPYWGCALRQTTGWPCPGCGLTRVAEHVSRFELSAAWEANPLGTVAALVFVLLAVATFVHLVFRRPLPRVQLSSSEEKALRVAVVGLVVVNYGWIILKAKFPEWVGGP
jgi:hypothetical protein